jgi:competence protein ComEA
MKSQFMPKNFGLPQHQFDISQQQTVSCPITPPLPLTDQSTQPLLSSVQLADTTPELPTHEQTEATPHEWVEEEKALTKKPGKLRLVIILAIIGFGCAIYFIWRSQLTNSSSAPLLSPSSSTNKGNSSSSTTTNVPGSTIQVYIAGAVQHPGVYALSGDARIYQLLDAAGGPLPDANLVALNLAGKLVDGQEVYVSRIGETPPAVGSTGSNSNNQGQLVNINTTSAADLQQKLHLSAKSAQDIINYRQQHGPFQSIDQLLQVVSQSIYNKIKGQITV